MENRTIKNALGGTGFIGSLLILVIPKIIAAFDAADKAQRVHDMMELVNKSDWQINWDGIWLLVYIFSVLYLIGVNLDLFRAWRERKRQAEIRVWNVKIVDALNWIANSSYQGGAVNYDNRYNLAVGAFREKAMQGKIAVGGILAGTFNQQKIPLKEWRRLKLSYGCASGRNNYGNEGQINLAELRDEEKKIVWSGLAVDRNELKRTWSGSQRDI